MLEKPRVSDDVLSCRRAFTCNFPDGKLSIEDPLPPTMYEEVALVRDLHEARAELSELCRMIQFFDSSPDADDVEPTQLVRLSRDIQEKYSWVGVHEAAPRTQ